MHNEVPLLQRLYDFYKIYFGMVDHFPKKSRLVLTPKIEQVILELLQSISQASFSQSEEKIKTLQEASSKVDFLKILFRLCYELKIIDQKKYFLLEQNLVEIGRMIGGWLKTSTASK